MLAQLHTNEMGNFPTVCVYQCSVKAYMLQHGLVKWRPGIRYNSCGFKWFEFCIIRETFLGWYFTEYLSVLFQLTYLDELYGECNGTARACVNSGYQALFSPITERLGTRLVRGLRNSIGYVCLSSSLSHLTAYYGIPLAVFPIPVH